MNNIYIPAIGNQDFIYIQPQIYSENEDYDNILVTGLIDNEIEQSIYISTTLLIKQKIKIPNFLHTHFPDYNYYKSGISASLGIYYSLLCHLSNRILKNSYLMTGEIDIEGNIYEIGQFKEKMNAYMKSEFDYFIVPEQNVCHPNESSNVIPVSNIYELDIVMSVLETNNEIK